MGKTYSTAFLLRFNNRLHNPSLVKMKKKNIYIIQDFRSSNEANEATKTRVQIDFKILYVPIVTVATPFYIRKS